LRQPPGADPIAAVLVFLDLLERHAEAAAERALRHALGQAQRADRSADHGIDWACAFASHVSSPWQWQTRFRRACGIGTNAPRRKRNRIRSRPLGCILWGPYNPR